MVRVSQEVWRELERTRAMHGYRFAAIIDQWMLAALGAGSTDADKDLTETRTTEGAG